MVAISVRVDRRAALLAGRDLGERVTIDVSPETIGAELWPELVKRLVIGGKEPPELGNSYDCPEHVQVVDATAESVRDALAGIHARRAAETESTVAIISQQMAALRLAAKQPPVAVQLLDTKSFERYAGFQRLLPSVSTYHPRPTDEINVMVRECEEIRQASAAEIAALNATALAEQLPGILAERAVRSAALAIETAREEEAKEARIAALAALRLETGYWEVETGAYNDRRYGAPWCAKVTGLRGRGELVYEWGDSTAKFGRAGLLRVACKPGEIVAWEQKDMRKPTGSTHELLRMGDDGRMTAIDKTEAYRLLTNKARVG